MSEHILPKRTYFIIWAVLLVFTYLTLEISYHDFGAWNIVAALTIAVIKATLVVLFFMHAKYSSRLTWAVIAAGVFWLFLLLALTLNDYLLRDMMTYPGH